MYHVEVRCFAEFSSASPLMSEKAHSSKQRFQSLLWQYERPYIGRKKGSPLLSKYEYSLFISLHSLDSNTALCADLSIASYSSTLPSSNTFYSKDNFHFILRHVGFRFEYFFAHGLHHVPRPL